MTPNPQHVLAMQGRWPMGGSLNASTVGLNNADTVDGVSEKMGIVFVPDRVGAIRYVWWKQGTITTGTTVGSPVTLGFYQVDTSTGTPAAPPVLFDAACTAIDLPQFTDTDDYTSYRTDLGSGNTLSVTPASGLIALVWILPAATPPYMRRLIMDSFGQLYHAGCAFPYGVTALPTWGRAICPQCCAIEYTDGSVQCIGSPISSGVVTSWATTFGSTSNPNMRGVEITPFCAMRVTHLIPRMDFDFASTVFLYDNTTGEVLRSVAWNNPNLRGGSAVGYFSLPVEPVWLTAGRSYALMSKSQSSSSIGTGFEFPVYDPNGNVAQALAAGGWDPSTGSRLTGNGWPFTKDPLTRMMGSVAFDQVAVVPAVPRTRTRSMKGL